MGTHLYLLAILFVGFTGQAQNFPYFQQWGSYVGGAGTHLFDYSRDESAFFTDSAHNLYVNGQTSPVINYTPAYYNQFITAGGNAASAPMPSTYFYESTFGVNGQMLFGTYSGSNNNSISIYHRLIGIDHLDNKFYYKREQGHVPNLATAGTWLSASTNSNYPYTHTLAKYDAAGNLLWRTYLPNTNHDAITLRFDEANNIYLIGETNENIPGVGTAGTYQENFIPYFTPTGSASNSYMVKLNPSGQQVWGTYSVAGSISTAYYGGSLYTINDYNSYMPGQLTTPGTFQPSIAAAQLIMKWDALTGQRVWSTFYGPASSLNNYVGMLSYDIAANASGVFISGQSDEDGSTYYATPGAFKGQVTGGGDLFLSKFDFSGNRVWSTYFGGSDYEYIYGSANMTVLGNRIVITGNQSGNTSNISTPGAFRTSAGNTTAGASNMFFAEFDTNGARLWASYFGGPGTNPFQEQANPEFLDDGTLILWGLTGAQTGIATAGGQFPVMLNPSPPAPFGFVTRFVFKEGMGTNDTENLSDLVLYDNPNNGNFALSGSVLQKENCSLAVFDASGRKIADRKLSKAKLQQFELAHLLVPGNYLLQLSGNSKNVLKVFKMTVKK